MCRIWPRSYIVRRSFGLAASSGVRQARACLARVTSPVTDARPKPSATATGSLSLCVRQQPAPATSRWSDMYDRAGQRPCNARNYLNLGYYETAEVVDVLSFSANDHVVGPGHIVSLGYAGDLADGRCDVSGLPDLGLDEDISLDHVALRSSV